MKQQILQLFLILFMVGGLMVGPASGESEEPSLPSGLTDESMGADEPGLPAGLSAEEPTLPSGLEETGTEATELEEKESAWPFNLNGFWETRAGVRLYQDRYEGDTPLGETRLQLEISKAWDKAAFNVTADFLYDWVYDHHSIDLETGEGWLDLRQANISLTPVDFLDIKVGRQILTWGTGDLIFINDLFPKDWDSFFIGRDTEYLKAPSDAIKFSFYGKLVNLDFVYTPRFDADRYIDGRRISYYNAMLGRRAGEDAIIHVDKPDSWFRDDEFAGRLFKNIKGYELAIYGYWGFSKSPSKVDPATGRYGFADTSVYGGSIRGPFAKGIGNIEAGYYYAEDDPGGIDPYVNNSQFRLLLGYEQDLGKDLTVGVQYYLEQMMDYNDYVDMLPAGMPRADHYRQLVTIRLTKLLMSQNLRLSMFAYYSPTDNDAYLRPSVNYKIDDHLSVQMGGNFFFGKDQHTFFGQFERNTNVYAALRYAF